MSKGFLVLADGEDYIKMAYALALSLKLTQQESLPITLVTNDIVNENYKYIFDNILNVPWSEKEDTTRFKVEHRWKLYHASPYEETVVFDADSLVLDDLSRYWKEFSKYDIYYCSKVETYRGDLTLDDYYRQAFTANNLPNLYNALHYFKKREFSKEFYSWVELITNNWELFYGRYVKEFYPNRPSMDITTALAAKIMDCDKEITNYNRDPVKITHMKSMIQGWKNPTESWMTAVGTYFDDNCQLKIGNFKQSGVFHYTEKNFMTDEIIEKLEKAWQKN